MFAVLNALLTFLSSKWSPVAALGTAAYVVYNNVLGIITATHSLIASFDAATNPTLSGSGVSVSALGFINYILPLDAAIAMFELWVPWMLFCYSVRIVKAFVPSVA